MNLPKNEASSVLKNPFYHRGPIRDHCYFFGRTKETRQALQMLDENQCISVVGPRRIGKTSFLFHLCDPEVRKEYGIGDEHLFVYVDCQGLEDLDRLQFYRWLWKEAKKSFGERGEGEGWAQSISNFNDLRDAMEMVQNRGYRPIFLFDEFESLAMSKNMDQALFSSLRNLSEGFQVTYATASQMPVQELEYYDNSTLGSPFFNNFQNVPLNLLEPGEAREMVLNLTEMIGRESYFLEEDLSFAFAVAGYHPFFLQVACYHLFERKTERGGLTAEDYEAVRQRYVEDVERYFYHIWNHSAADEQESMRLICEGKVSDLSAEKKQQLESKCVLYGDALFSSAFTEFVRKQAGIEPKKVLAPVLPPPEGATESSEPRTCRLSITCSKYGWVSVRVAGSLSYEADSGRMLEQGLVDRLCDRATKAVRSQDWRSEVKDIGQELFEDLVLNRPEVGEGYQRAASYVGQAVLSLALHAPRQFLRLPFESLHSGNEDYLCFNYPMYRVVSGHVCNKKPLSTAFLNQPHFRDMSHRALVIASNTWRKSKRREEIPAVEEEVQQVNTMLRRHGFDVCVLSTDEATEERVRYELENGGYSLFHYAGHGSHDPDSSEKSALHFWEGRKGKSKVKKLTASDLKILIQNTPLRFVYLSSCWGAYTAHPTNLLEDDFLGVMDGVVMGGVPAVLGFRWPVSDPGAQSLAESFYSALLDEHKELEEALLQARTAVVTQHGRDEWTWFSPVLAMIPTMIL